MFSLACHSYRVQNLDSYSARQLNSNSTRCHAGFHLQLIALQNMWWSKARLSFSWLFYQPVNSDFFSMGDISSHVRHPRMHVTSMKKTMTQQTLKSETKHLLSEKHHHHDVISLVTKNSELGYTAILPKGTWLPRVVVTGFNHQLSSQPVSITFILGVPTAFF